MSTGAWAAVAGLPALGVVAAHEHGIPVERLLLPNPGPDRSVVVAALLDGVDMVVVAPAGNADAATVRTLAARTRSRAAVLVSTRPWVGCDLTLTVTRHDWAGLGTGRGRLRGHQIAVRATGRGAAARPREITVPVPSPWPDPLPAAQRPVSGTPVETAAPAIAASA